MRKQTYGRRTNAPSALTAQCFSGSSPTCVKGAMLLQNKMTFEKPAVAEIQSSKESKKAASPVALPDSPASNTRSRAKERDNILGINTKPKKLDFFNDEQYLDDMSSKMGNLDITTEESATALRHRDINTSDRLPKTDVNKEKCPKKAERNDDNEENLRCAIEALSMNENKVDEAPSPSPLAKKTQPRKATRRPKTTNSAARTSGETHAAYAKPLLSLCGDPKGRKAPTPFKAWADDISTYFRIVKIAEASYGEVYRLSLKATPVSKSSNAARIPLSTADESVLKIIALNPPPSRAADAQSGSKHDSAQDMSAMGDVASEVRVLRHLSAVPGFTNFRDVRVVQGRVPRPFVQAWRAYNKDVKKSLFADPGLKSSYSEDQLWAVVEMQDAGTDLETLVERVRSDMPHVSASAEARKKESPGRTTKKKLAKADSHEQSQACFSVWLAWDIFWGVTLAVAKGEEYAAFEHRDLHMGNICIRSKHMTGSKILNPPHASLDISRTIGYTGIETTLIDYTLSRAYVGREDGFQSSKPSTRVNSHHEERNDGVEGKDDDDSIAFFDLSKDDAIFQGDASEDYQYDIYRFMRSAVMHEGDPLFDQKTHTQNKNTRQRTAAGKKHQATERSNGGEWRERHPVTNLIWLHFVLYKLMQEMEICSGTESSAVAKDEPREEKLHALARELQQRLKILKGVLRLETMARSEIRSAAELVQWALNIGWLAEEDVIGLHDGEGACSPATRSDNNRE